MFRTRRWIAPVSLAMVVALTGTASMSACQHSCTPSPSRTVVIGSAYPTYVSQTNTSRPPRYVGLAGTWEHRKGWHDLSWEELYDEDVAQRLAREGTAWVLYHMGRPPIEVKSGVPILVPEVREVDPEGDSGPSIRAPLLWGSLRAEDPSLSYLAVSGIGKIDRVNLRLLPPDDTWANGLVRKALRGLGERLDFKVTQNVAVDLDRDGRPDRLVAVELPKDPDPAPMTPAMPGAMILAMLDRGHSVVQTVVVRDAVDKVWSYTTENEIQAVADIDGDGFREIAVLVYGPDLSAWEIFRCDGKRLKQVLSWIQE